MSPKINSKIAVIGIDLGKNSFCLVGPGSALQPCPAQHVGPDTEDKGARHVPETR
jgi:hypothetical protein